LGAVSWTGLVLLAMSVGLNTLQARRIREFLEPTTVRTSRVGHSVIPFTGQSIDGRLRTFQFADREPTVIYFFSPKCRWCEENWANVQALSAAAEGRFRFVAVAAETGLAGFARDHNLDFDILGGVSAEALKSLGFGATPHLLVVSSEGQISEEWVGAFRGRQQRAIESFFEVKLPGLVRPAEPR